MTEVTTSTSWLRSASSLAAGLRWRLTFAAALGAGALGAAVALTATSAWLLSRAAEHPPVLDLMVAIVAVRAFGLGRGVLRYAERLVAHDAAFRILAATRVRLFTALERLGPTGLPDYRTGDLLARLVDDVDGLQDLYLRVAVPVVAGGVVGAGTAVAVGVASPLAGCVVAAGLAVAALAVPAWATWRAARSARAEVQARGQLAASTVDALAGAADLLALGAERRQLGSVERLDGELARAARADARVAAAGAALGNVASGATVLAAAVVGVAAVHAGRLPGELLATVVLAPMAAFEAVAAFPAAAGHLDRARTSLGRVTAILGRPPTATEPATPAAPPTGPIDVRLTGVGATWPGASRPALADIDLELGPGRRVAVVGPSGAGKSTLAAVLLGFLPATSGSVTVGGVPLGSLADEDLRAMVGACGQEAHVFDATIADNLRIGCVDASEDQLRIALSRSGLLQWVESLPDGLTTSVGENGQRLSGGQRQRLVLARELLADRPVVILDEPTEHLEESLADEVTADLLAAVAGRTTVLVTHRLSGLEDVDEIVVLVRGRVVQRGRHTDLVHIDGWYRSAWAEQH